MVLYGHRRMGKSSVLQNLRLLKLGDDTRIVDFNLQRIGRVDSTGELLHVLCLKLYDCAVADGVDLPEPVATDFCPPQGKPYLACDRFLARVDGVRGRRRFLVTVDEFELIEDQISAGRVDAHLLAHLRATFQTYPWLIFAFAGLHRLEELRHDYWHPLFGSVTSVEISYLSAAAARRLITAPSPDFSIDYDADAIEHIVALTHGQPYLVQLLCHALVARYNLQLFEDDTPPPRRFRRADVDHVVAQPSLFRDGAIYFHGVWNHAVRAAGSQPAAEPAAAAVPGPARPAALILRALSAAGAEGLTADQLSQQAALPPAEVEAALRALLRQAVVVPVAASGDSGAPAGGAAAYHIPVALLRRFIVTSPDVSAA